MGIVWNNGIEGYAVIELKKETIKLSSVIDIKSLIEKSASSLPPSAIEVLGAMAFFFVMRDYVLGNNEDFLNSTEKALDSLYLITPYHEFNNKFEYGIDFIREKAFKYRMRQYHEVIKIIFKTLEELLKCIAK